MMDNRYWWAESGPRALPDNTLPYYFPHLKTGVGQSENKARPKRKPRPKKSARGKK